MPGKKCVVHACTNLDNEGAFVGQFCLPCYDFIVHGHGADNQVVRNIAAMIYRRITEDLTSAGISMHTAQKNIDHALKMLKKVVT